MTKTPTQHTPKKNSPLKRFFITILLLVTLLLSWIYIATYHPNDVEVEAVFSPSDAPLLENGQEIKVLSWNIQFLAGNHNNHFFYDHGPDAWPSLKTVNQTAEWLAQIIKQENPDVILLQEVDDGAKRTHYKDQLKQILALLPKDYVSHTSSFYWLADFLPLPEIWGAVGMKMSIISKYKLENGLRYALPSITSDNIIRKQFNVKRAIHTAQMPINGGGSVQLLNTHLSAFAQGTNTMEKQIAFIQHVLSQFNPAKDNVILAGDFNLVASKVSYNRLDKKRQGHYNPVQSELTPLIKKYNSIPSLAEIEGENYAKWFTHSSNDDDSIEPDKTIDYMFYLGGLTLKEHYIKAGDARKISDHLPVIATFSVN
jgi:endonuclease/exonuclease/phosphatase family metal-dependent hydrolase